MENTPLKKDYPQINISRFIFDQERNIYTHPDNLTTDYTDGGEEYILESLKKVKDLSSYSQEFKQYIKDWPSRYHFSNKRINFLEAIQEIFPKSANVLEIGSGCGAITRWLGEHFNSVDALEGNTQRALITRYRTKDLDNVKVYCGNLLNSGFDKKYDLIILIGSLEYTPLYDTEHADPKEACSSLLTRLNGALNENGILVVAIENKFGAKYFSGCKEDHTGKEFEGIIGYPDKTPVTFSRNEIESIIHQSGFINNQFYHVFPDYKLTETIIPENSEVISLYPQNWIRTPFEDYFVKQLNLFPDSLFMSSITDSGLLWQFSNSFVILATKSKNVRLSVDWLIKKYSNNDNFQLKFHHTITLSKNFSDANTEKKYLVHRAHIFNSPPIVNEGKIEFALQDNELVLGRLLSSDILSAVFKKSPESNLKQILKDLHAELLRTYSLGITDPEGYPLVNGEAIDYTFWNIIVSPENTFNFIDKKWLSKEPLPADLILFRNVYHIFEKIGPFFKNKNKNLFIIEMLQDIYPQYSEHRLTENFQFEALFQEFVSGKEQTYFPGSPSPYSVNEQIDEMRAQVININQTLASKEQQITDINNHVNYLYQTLASKEQQITETNNHVNYLYQTLASKEQQITVMATQVQSLEHTITDKVQQIHGLNENIYGLTENVQSLETALANEHTQVLEGTAHIQELDQVISAKDSQLAEKSAYILSLEQKIAGIETSIVWQLTMKFHYKIVGRILAENTQRRKYYELGLNRMRNYFNRYKVRNTHNEFKTNTTVSSLKKYFHIFKNRVTTTVRGQNPADVYSERCEFTSENIPEIREKITQFTYLPKLSIITPVYNVDEKWLKFCIDSVLEQIYENWELCLVDDASTKSHVSDTLKSYYGSDPRIRIEFNEKNSGISETTNNAIKMATGEFITLLDNDDAIPKDALFEVVKFLNEHPDADIIYSDEDKLSENGDLCEPFFKPDWSPEYFRGVMYVGHLLTVRRSLAEKISLLDKKFDFVQDYEFMLRLSENTKNIYHIPKLLYHWRKIEGSIASSSDSKGNISEKQVNAVNSHLKRLSLNAIASAGHIPHRVLITPLPRADFPLVSIIIPTKDKPELIERCLKSIYELTSYPNFEVIIMDNNTTNEDAKRILDSFPCKKILFNEPFNFSKINNVGAKNANGEYLVFLNNDTQIQSKNWIDFLLYYAEQPDVAAVGPLLVFPNNTVQHAGVVLGFRGTADHIMRDYPMDCDGYAGSLLCAREVSAITAACMMVKKSVFLELYGFNEHYSIIYQDVDLCLKFISNGYRIIFNPRVIITHYECSTRDITQYNLVDRNLLLDQWEELIKKGDRYYNCNFDLANYGLGSTGYKIKEKRDNPC